MQKFILILILGSILSCSPKIQSITTYEKIGNEFIPVNITKFDENGNKYLSKGLRNSRSNRITTSEFENNQKVIEKSCEYFKSHDTCVVRSFSKYEFDNKSGIEKQTLYESDSAIRFIKETKRMKRIEIQKIYSWEFSPKKNPKIKDALVLTDTVYFDNKDREIKRIHHNPNFKEPWIEIYKYHKNGYFIQTIGTTKDTIIEHKTTHLQKLANRNRIDYKFNESENVQYKIEYF